MEKAIEINVNEKELKDYLEECLAEENINYEVRIEDRWIERFKEASKYYQVYCIYVDSNYLEKVEKMINDFKNATIITDGIEELKDIEKDDETYNKSNREKFLIGFFWTLIIINVLIAIIAKILY